MTDNNELLELAKKCSAVVTYEGAQHTILFEGVAHLEMFADSLKTKLIAEGWRQCAKGQGETQHCTQAEELRARNAMLMEEINILVSDTPADIWTDEYRHRYDNATSATQQDTDAFIAEVRMNIAEEIQTACANGLLPSCCEGAADWILRQSAVQPEGKEANHCRRCGGKMKPGIATKETYTGIPDFPGTDECVTLYPGGSGYIGTCMKCVKCGWSVEGKGTRK